MPSALGSNESPFVEGAGAKHVLLELVAAACEGFVDGEPQQLAKTLGALEELLLRIVSRCVAMAVLKATGRRPNDGDGFGSGHGRLCRRPL